MEIARNIELLASAGASLADSAEAAGLSAEVPSCPAWTVRDLLAHVGMVHRWAATIVGEARSGPAVGATDPPEDTMLDWYREGHAALVGTLTRAPADVTCWSFLPSPSPLDFWSRRQLHETAIHRVDAGLANGEAVAYDADLAADGVDEIITKFLPRPSSKIHFAAERSLVVHATDAGRAWRTVIGPDTPTSTEITGMTTSPAGDCTVRGTATDLYLLLWNRRDAVGLDVEGDGGLLDAWRTHVHVQWR